MFANRTPGGVGEPAGGASGRRSNIEDADGIVPANLPIRPACFKLSTGLSYIVLITRRAPWTTGKLKLGT
jgi:hypothetical protein